MSENKWFVIINPTSGNGAAKKQWTTIESLLLKYLFHFEYHFTTHEKHSIELIQKAVNQGFKHVICIGGDGTIHNTVNGILLQNEYPTHTIRVGVIPIGTGNDWVKTHEIPRDIEKAIQIIKNGKEIQQDIGKIQLMDANIDPIYFNNLAGVGFDGYVVSKVGKYKHFGPLAYLIGTLMGLFSFKNFDVSVTTSNKTITTKALMVLIGLCKYSGGGMQLTKLPDYSDGLFDISIAKNFNVWDILKNTLKLFNGAIVNFKKVETFKTDTINISINDPKKPFIQADGELIGTGNFKVSIVPKAITFYCK